MIADTVTLDVRDDLRRGREPMAKILAAARELQPGQKLRLRATFEPIPLFRVLGSMGFAHDARRIAEDDWEVIFRPCDTAAARPNPTREPAPGDAGAGADGAWPPASRTLDNRGLLPPEPMMRVLEALEGLDAGAVLEVLNDREPAFLYPELSQRGIEVRSQPLEKGVQLHLRRTEDPA